MDSICLSESQTVIEGVRRMLTAYLGEHGYAQTSYVDIAEALLIVAIAKVASDNEEWFPRGKWATIQAIEERIDREIAQLTIAAIAPGH